MEWTEQGERGLRPRGVRMYGHGVGFSVFGLAGQINSKIY